MAFCQRFPRTHARWRQAVRAARTPGAVVVLSLGALPGCRGPRTDDPTLGPPTVTITKVVAPDVKKPGQPIKVEGRVLAGPHTWPPSGVVVQLRDAVARHRSYGAEGVAFDPDTPRAEYPFAASFTTSWRRARYMIQVIARGNPSRTGGERKVQIEQVIP